MGVKKKTDSEEPHSPSVAVGHEARGHPGSSPASHISQKKRKDKMKTSPGADACTGLTTLESTSTAPDHRKRKAQISARTSSSGVAVESQAADASVSTKKHKREAREQGSRNEVASGDSLAASLHVGDTPGGPQTKKSRTGTAHSGKEHGSVDPATIAASGHVVASTRKNKSKKRFSSPSGPTVSKPQAFEEDRATKPGSVASNRSAGRDDKVAAAGAASHQVDAAHPRQAKERKKNKKDKKKATEPQAENEKPAASARDAALAYLDTWKRDRRSWSFQKVRQVWLLQHMYSAADVDKDRFEVLLEYLEPLKGNARIETVRKAEEILAKADENVETEASDGTVAAPVDELVLLRAKEIVQHLSTE